jgi:chitinase
MIELFGKLKSLKARKPNLKTLLRITDDGRVLTRIAKNAASRANFIKNILEYISNHKFDGVDIDWQYPNGPNGHPEDKQNYAILLKVNFNNAYLHILLYTLI